MYILALRDPVMTIAQFRPQLANLQPRSAQQGNCFEMGILFFLPASVLHPNKPKHDLSRKIAKADKSADKTLNIDVFIDVKNVSA